MTRIGIMGGTFNPIHKGHIEIAKAAQQQYQLDEIWFIPNHIPAYKSQEELVDGNKRLRMVELATAAYETFKTLDLELKREGNTYTYVTMRELKEQYPNYDFYFIMGADSLFSFENWVHPELIVTYCNILCTIRNDVSSKKLRKQILHLNKLYNRECFHFVECMDIPCSSSKIRECILSQNISVASICQNYLKKYLDASVYEYIKSEHLYSNLN